MGKPVMFRNGLVLHLERFDPDGEWQVRRPLCAITAEWVTERMQDLNAWCPSGTRARMYPNLLVPKPARARSKSTRCNTTTHTYVVNSIVSVNDVLMGQILGSILT